MADSRATTADILEGLATDGLLDRGHIPEIVESLKRPPSEFPWVLHLFMGAGAWLAALSFISFLWFAGLVTDDAPNLIAWGSALIASSTVLRRRSDHPFLAQACLALSMAGHGLLLGGVGEETGSLTVVAGSAILVSAILYRLYRDAGHRFLTVGTAAVILAAAAWESPSHHTIHAVLLVEAALLAGLMRSRHPPKSLQPLACSIAFMMLATFWILASENIETSEWPSKIIAGIGLVAAVGWATRAGPWRFLVVPAALLGVIASAGLSATLAVMVAGAARRDRLLEGIGTAFFLPYLVFYYYSLQTTLLAKSWILIGSGLILLGARVWVEYRVRNRGEAA